MNPSLDKLGTPFVFRAVVFWREIGQNSNMSRQKAKPKNADIHSLAYRASKELSYLVTETVSFCISILVKIVQAYLGFRDVFTKINHKTNEIKGGGGRNNPTPPPLPHRPIPFRSRILE